MYYTSAVCSLSHRQFSVSAAEEEEEASIYQARAKSNGNERRVGSATRWRRLENVSSRMRLAEMLLHSVKRFLFCQRIKAASQISK